MSIEKASKDKFPRKRDPDLGTAEVALKRAAINAREQAKLNGIFIVTS